VAILEMLSIRIGLMHVEYRILSELRQAIVAYIKEYK